MFFDFVFSQGDDNSHYEKVGNTTTLLPELDDIEIPYNWILCRFATIANIFTGNSINEQEKAKNTWDGWKTIIILEQKTLLSIIR